MKKGRKKALKKPAIPKKKRTGARKVSVLTRKPKRTSKSAKRRAVKRSVVKSKKVAVRGKRRAIMTRKQIRGRAKIVRRRNKAGRIYYFNKKTAKFTKKSNWYKYRAWAIKRKPRKAPTVPAKEKEKLTIDLESALIKINLDKATEPELREEINRLVMEQMRWRDRLNTLKLKKNKNKVRKQLTRYARAINKIKKILGTYEKPQGFEEKEYQIGKDVSVDNVYRWEAKKFLDDVLGSEMFDVYIVQGVSFMAEHEIDIHLAVDDVIIDAEMNDIYYLRFTRNSRTKVVHITLNS
jgi:hypothetical protein